MNDDYLVLPIIINPARILQAIIESGWTEGEACMEAHVNHDSLRKLKAGKMPKPDVIRRLCKTLNIPVREVVYASAPMEKGQWDVLRGGRIDDVHDQDQKRAPGGIQARAVSQPPVQSGQDTKAEIVGSGRGVSNLVRKVQQKNNIGRQEKDLDVPSHRNKRLSDFQRQLKGNL